MPTFKNDTKKDVLVYATRGGYQRLAPGDSVDYPEGFPFRMKDAPDAPKAKKRAKKKTAK